MRRVTIGPAVLCPVDAARLADASVPLGELLA